MTKTEAAKKFVEKQIARGQSVLTCEIRDYFCGNGAWKRARRVLEQMQAAGLIEEDEHAPEWWSGTGWHPLSALVG
jgi:hypothetical protein